MTTLSGPSTGSHMGAARVGGGSAVRKFAPLEASASIHRSESIRLRRAGAFEGLAFDPSGTFDVGVGRGLGLVAREGRSERTTFLLFPLSSRTRGGSMTAGKPFQQYSAAPRGPGTSRVVVREEVQGVDAPDSSRSGDHIS
jgi:hypothetical protein